MSIVSAIQTAWQNRDELHRDPELDCYRIFHGWEEGTTGLEIDRYGPAALVSYKPKAAETLPEVIEALDRCHHFELIVGKPRGEEPTALRGPMPSEAIEVHEPGFTFLVDPWRARNPGLYLDARPARQWIRAHSDGRRVLNLFAFTGSLGVAAAVGGAAAVCHVDTQRGALQRCRANHERNGVPIDDRDLVRINIYQHLRKGAAGRRSFDAAILDPPPQSSPKDKTPGGRGISTLAPLAARQLTPGGWMLCLFHHSERDRDDHEREVIDSCDVPLEILWQGESGIDFPESDPRNKLRITAFVRR